MPPKVLEDVLPIGARRLGFQIFRVARANPASHGGKCAGVVAADAAQDSSLVLDLGHDQPLPEALLQGAGHGNLGMGDCRLGMMLVERHQHPGGMMPRVRDHHSDSVFGKRAQQGATDGDLRRIEDDPGDILDREAQ
jgi:hypothetical protein